MICLFIDNHHPIENSRLILHDVLFIASIIFFKNKTSFHFISTGMVTLNTNVPF